MKKTDYYNRFDLKSNYSVVRNKVKKISCIILLPLGLLLIIFSIVNWVNYMDYENANNLYSVVEATLLKSETVNVDKIERITKTYEYNVNNKTYVIEIKDNAEIGEKVNLFYDENDPSEAKYIKEPVDFYLIVTMFVTGLVFIFLILVNIKVVDIMYHKHDRYLNPIEEEEEKK